MENRYKGGEMLDEVRSAIRGMARRPMYTGVAVTILALGLSSGIGVFTYNNGFSQPFPGVDSRGLVQLFDATDQDPFRPLSYLDYVDVREAPGNALLGVAAVRSGYAATIRHELSTEVVFLEAVSGSYFPVLDVEMSLGRGIGPDDDRPGAEHVAVISDGWWRRQWNADPSVVGSVVHFNGRPHTVVGVAGPAFHGSLASFRPEAWLPFEAVGARYTSWARAAERRDVPLVRVLARLRDGADEAGASEDLRRVAAGLDDLYPRAEDGPRRITPAPATWIDPRARMAESDTVRLMIAAAAGFLLLVCANVANLLLAVATGRRRELALRAAIGASRVRLLRQVLVESVVLTCIAGVIAIGLAGPAAQRLGSYFARPSVWGENVAREMTLDGRVVLFALGISVVTGILAGLAPAIGASRRDVVDVLKTGSADGEGPARRMGGWRVPGIRDLMVSTQVGLSIVLLVVAGLTLRTLGNVSTIDPGFAYDSMLGSYISTSSTAVTEEERDLWFRTLARRLTAEPWVRSATISNQAPLTSHGSGSFRLEGRPDEARMVYATVIPGYLETLGIALVGGRDFSLSDSLGAPGVAIVNEVAARRYLPGGNPVGKTLWWPAGDESQERPYEIVGVVGDARIRDLLSEPEPVVYLANTQQPYASGSALTVATTIDPAEAVPRLYQWLRTFESHVAIVNVAPYPEVVRGFTYVQRMNAQMFSALALMGLLLAVVGIFSVTSIIVGQRTREIGIRMALGAERSQIRGMVFKRMSASVALGLTLGLGGALLLERWLQSLVFGVATVDPWSLVAVALVFTGAAVLAALVPAQRAARVEPVRSLQSE